MHQKIIDEVKTFSDENFAVWIRPFLSIPEDSDEIILGVRVPILRKLAKQFKNISIDDLDSLLKSNYHEVRELALFIMVLRVRKEPQNMCNLYLKNLKYINNWDLIDYTCPHIVAPNTEKDVLRELASSEYMWANRVAMVSTIYYIKRGDFSLALEFAKKFINHPHHLMHKASGWMLREVGKKDINVLKDFLNKYSSQMPSVMRSYAKEIFKK